MMSGGGGGAMSDSILEENPQLERQIADLTGMPADKVSILADLCEEVKDATDVAMRCDPQEDGFWQVCIVAADKPGILSIFNGLFTGSNVDIDSGDAFVFRPAARPAEPIRVGSFADRHRFRPHPLRQTPMATPRPKVLAIFRTRPPDGANAKFWSEFKRRLEEAVRLFAAHSLSSARETFIEYAVKAASEHRMREPGGEGQENPIVLKSKPSDGEKPAKLWVRGADTRGILFEVTSALAMLNVSIERLRIRTVDGNVRDTVWITDARGRHFSDEGRLQELCESTTLILQFMRLLARTPDPEQALQQFVQLVEDLVSRRDSDTAMRLESEQVLRTLAQVLGSSRFLWDDFLRMQHENLFPVILNLPIEERRSKRDMDSELKGLLKNAPDIGAAINELNRWKDRELFRIDLRHLMRKIDFTQFADELSDLAEVTVMHACRIAHQHLQAKYGKPQIDDRDCGWCVFGLGKLGGRELGYASDVELLFVYEGQGKTTGPEQIFNSDYFERFVCEFVRTVQAKRDGIFEVDLRLRPYGSAGSNACSLKAFESYFRTGGEAEQYQRLSLVKLNPITGDPHVAQAVCAARDRYVYSGEPIDYADIEHLRRLQRTQLVPKGEISAKHSAGGLVDLEYFVQSQQIEVGRREPSVRVTSTRQAIKRLVNVGHLPPMLAQDLLDNYGFMRRLIDSLRVVRGNAKDLTLPAADSRAFAYLARRMQYDHAELLYAQIEARMAFISKIWKFVER